MLHSSYLEVTIVQSSLYWNSPSQNKSHISQLLSKVTQTDLIVLPELFTTAFSMTAKSETMDGPSILWMSNLSKEKNALILASIRITENRKNYNRLICTFPDGKILSYDKRHLFSLMQEEKYFSSGKNRLIVDYKGWRICPLICYDLRFPVFSRNNEAIDILIYVANWPTSRISHWDKLLTARAIENQVFVVGVNRIGKDGNGVEFNGNSTIIDANGEHLYLAQQKEVVKSVRLNKIDLNLIRQKLPFLKDSDSFTLH